MRLFNRTIDDSDDSYINIRPLLGALHSADSDERQAMARNLAVDGRITHGREGSFLGFDFGGRTPSDIEKWVEIYFEQTVRYSADPTFLAEHNEGNRLRELLPETELVQVFRVGGLPPEIIGVVIDTMRTAPPELRRNLVTGPRAEMLAWSERALTELFPSDGYNSGPGSLAAEMRAEFIEKLWRYLGDNSPNFHPSWVGLWEEFKKLSTEPAGVWLAAFGSPKPSAPCLCFLLKYRVEDVGLVLRPTILDAGWRDLHFPSPPSHCEWRSSGPRPIGGHPVNFDPRPGALLQEYIHANVTRKPEWVVEWGWTSSDYRCKDTPPARADHLAFLVQCYDGVNNWYDAK